MLNNIKVGHTTDEIILNINVTSEIQEIVEELEAKLPKINVFYEKNNRLPIRISGRLLTESEVEITKKLITDHIKDAEIRFDDISDMLGLHSIKKTFETSLEISETKVVEYSLRSGQREEYAGSIVICGDVNPGAEIIAGGNILVLGTLRGVAHAGANGNKKAVISANSIDITQVRIANLVKEIIEKVDKCPICKVENNDIVVK